MRRLAIADVHGCGRRLEKVLREDKYSPGEDRLFLLGDYMDRGPDSKLTMKLVRRLVAEGAVALKGNHETMLLEAELDEFAYRHWLTQGGGVTCAEYGRFPPADILSFIRGLPLYHEEPDCILVHAGLRPGIPLAEQAPEDLVWIREEFHYHYRGKFVVFGHTPTTILGSGYKPWTARDKIGIDTGAYLGGPLTCYDLDTHETWTA